MSLRKKYKKLVIYGIIFCFLVIGLFSLNKRVFLNVNGDSVVLYTSRFSLSNFLESLSEQYNIEDYIYESDSKAIHNNMVVNVSTLKHLDVTVNGKTRQVDTYGITIDDLIKELGLKTSESIRYLAEGGINFLNDANSIILAKYENKMEVVDRKVALPALEVKNNQLINGVRKTTKAGAPKIVAETYEVIYKDGVEVSRTLSNSTTKSGGKAAVVEVGTKVTKVPRTVDDSTWDRLAACESGGNWAANTGNGYYGGLQFNPGTWNTAARAVGINARYASDATREEQILAAEWLLAHTKSGFGQWPACSKKLGLL